MGPLIDVTQIDHYGQTEARALFNLHFLRNPQKLVKMAEELREKFYGDNEQSKEAFEELFAMVSAMEAEREEARENARARVELLYDRCHKMRVKNQTLKTKNQAVTKKSACDEKYQPFFMN